MGNNPYHYNGFLTKQDKVAISEVFGGVGNVVDGPAILGYNPDINITVSGNVTSVRETLPNGNVLLQTIEYGPASGQVQISRQYQES